METTQEGSHQIMVETARIVLQMFVRCKDQKKVSLVPTACTWNETQRIHQKFTMPRNLIEICARSHLVRKKAQLNKGIPMRIGSLLPSNPMVHFILYYHPTQIEAKQVKPFKFRPGRVKKIWKMGKNEHWIEGEVGGERTGTQKKDGGNK